LQQISKRNEDEEFCIDFDVAPDGVLHEGRRGKGRHRSGGWQDAGGVLQLHKQLSRDSDLSDEPD
jgi:hypothetical protein